MVMVLRGSWGATGGAVRNFMYEISKKNQKKEHRTQNYKILQNKIQDKFLSTSFWVTTS